MHATFRRHRGCDSAFDRDGEPYGAFTKTIDLLGDSTIRLIYTPGHTAGHLSVLLRLAA